MMRLVVDPDRPAAPAGRHGVAAPGARNRRREDGERHDHGLLKQKVAAGSKEEKELAAQGHARACADFLDIDELGKRAMADQWGKLTAAQQKEFLDSLRELIEDNYVKGLRSNLDYTVEYTGETTDKDGNVVVETKIKTKRQGRPIQDRGRLRAGQERATSTRAWDVKTDGVGLVENYRDEFNKIIDKDGFDGLMAKMRTRRKSRAVDESRVRARNGGFGARLASAAPTAVRSPAVGRGECRSIRPTASPPKRGSPKTPDPADADRAPAR